MFTSTPVGFLLLAPVGLAGLLLGTGCIEDILLNDDGDATEEPGHVYRDLDRQENSGFRHVVTLGEIGHGFNGVDILVVVDNTFTAVMEDARDRLATHLYALLSQMIHPTGTAAPLDAVRLAVTSSDMGLQSGRTAMPPPGSGQDGAPLEVADGCDPLGDDGSLGQGTAPALALESGVVPCEIYGYQCPTGWQCLEGVCVSPPGDGTISCPDLLGAFAATSVGDPNRFLREQAACMISQPTSGCVIRQPLEAALKALYTNPGFLLEDHLLLVIILSDRDDCSIRDPAFFDSQLWNERDLRRACSDSGNIGHLYPVTDYRDGLIALKGGNAAAVLFAAVVGAPLLVCDGSGSYIGGMPCLSSIEQDWFEVPDGDGFYYEARHACEYPVGSPQESPKPAKRLIELATRFGDAGFVQPMCDSSWMPMVGYVTESIRSRLLVGGECVLDVPLETEETIGLEGCTDCRVSVCDLYAKITSIGDGQEALTCPEALVYGSDYWARAGYMQRMVGAERVTHVICPIRQLPAPKECGVAAVEASAGQTGWYYCQNDTDAESSENACSDGVDNDGDRLVDCEDNSCAACFTCGNLQGCPLGCAYDVVLTPDAASAVEGHSLFLDCPYF